MWIRNHYIQERERILKEIQDIDERIQLGFERGPEEGFKLTRILMLNIVEQRLDDLAVAQVRTTPYS